MPKAKIQAKADYVATRGIACRRSLNKDSQEWDQFWEAIEGESLADAPDFIDLEGLLEAGAIELKTAQEARQAAQERADAQRHGKTPAEGVTAASGAGRADNDEEGSENG